MLTRVFKSGNSLAVRIPKELAIVEASQDVEIEKVGDTWCCVRRQAQADRTGSLPFRRISWPKAANSTSRRTRLERLR